MSDVMHTLLAAMRLLTFRRPAPKGGPVHPHPEGSHRRRLRCFPQPGRFLRSPRIQSFGPQALAVPAVIRHAMNRNAARIRESKW
jgi:hypothetical protein